MSNKRKRPPLPSWKSKLLLASLADGPPVEDPIDQLKSIFDEAPAESFLGEGKMAVWSATCCWWSSNPHTVGKTTKAGLPGCPSCGSPLFQGPLRKFIDASSGTPEHYGDHGLAAFVAAHNRVPCHQTWGEYEVGPVKVLEMSDPILPEPAPDVEGEATP